MIKIKGIPGSTAHPDYEISISQFFLATHNIKLEYGAVLPCVCVGSEGRILIPMELCEVRQNQRYVKKLNDIQQAQMVKVTAVGPSIRKSRIEEGLK